MKKLFLALFASCMLLSSCGNSSTTTSKPESEVTKSVDKPTAPKSDGVIRVLFVGNSHTEYFASFPKMLEALAKANNKKVEVEGLITMGVSIDKILADNKKKADTLFAKTDTDGNYFDYMILQESTPIAYQEPEKFLANSQTMYDLAKVNSPGLATYIYQLAFPENYSDSDYKSDQKVLTDNVTNITKTIPNSGVLPFAESLAAAYEGKEGYTAIVEGNDKLRFTDNSRHMLNDAVFLNSVILYQYLFNETPSIPNELPLSTGTGDNDEIKLMNVNEGISNVEGLVKIASSFK